jgi:hypothetical protein
VESSCAPPWTSGRPGWWPYRIVNGQCGQLLAEPSFFALPNDGVVAVEETRLGSAAPLIELQASHTFMMNNRQVRATVRELLARAAAYPGGSMEDWLVNLPVLWMGALILGVVYLITAGIYLIVTALAVGDRARAFKAISPGILPPLAILFGLLVGFLAAQDWSEGERAGAAVYREASALRGVVLLAAAFPGEPEARLRQLIRDHIQEVVTEEWPAMARQDVTLTLAAPKLVEALRLCLLLRPEGDGQTIAQREMVSALENAFDARRQRIILSGLSINWVKWTVLLIQAGLTLVTIALVHCDNRLANRIVLAIFASGIGAAVLLVASHSRPFAGQVAVRPAVLLQVMPEAGPSGVGR